MGHSEPRRRPFRRRYLAFRVSATPKLWMQRVYTTLRAEGDGVFFVAGGSPPEETIGALWAFSSYNNDWRQVSWDLEAPYAAAMAVEGMIRNVSYS